MTKEIIMYTRTADCPFVSIAESTLSQYQLLYRKVFIDRHDEARQQVLDWTGYLSVPTIIITDPGGVLPYEAPQALEDGASPRGINRGSMITEPNQDQLTAWLVQHQLVDAMVIEEGALNIHGDNRT